MLPRCAGILGLDDDDKGGGEGAGAGGADQPDEILAELRKKQAELRALSAQNGATLRSLLSQAREEVVRQGLRDKLAAADTEVCTCVCVLVCLHVCLLDYGRFRS